MSRPMRAGEEAIFAQIVNDTYALLRSNNALPPFVEDWTVETVTNFTGDKWVHPNTGPIESVALSTLQTLRGEVWQVFHVLGVKASVANKEAASLKVLDEMVRESATRGAVGATCSISSNATTLRAFLESWPVAVIEEHGTYITAWMRHQAGFPEWTRRVKPGGK